MIPVSHSLTNAQAFGGNSRRRKTNGSLQISLASQQLTPFSIAGWILDDKSEVYGSSQATFQNDFIEVSGEGDSQCVR